MRVGSQAPTIRIVPSYSYTDGEDAGEFAAAYGLDPFPWQQDVLNVLLARDDNDQLVTTRLGLSVPRQNGKNAIIEIRELYGIVIMGEKILHTAHEVKTAREAFNRIAGFFGPTAPKEMQDMVVAIRRTNGQEAIVLRNGGEVRFSARSTGAGRGFTMSTMIFDECQHLTDDQLDALMAIISASPTKQRQLIFTGTPPSPAMPADSWKRLRMAAVDGKFDNHDAWFEWSVDEVGDISDVDRWYATNPSMGYLLDEDYTAKEMSQQSPLGFARERLGFWDTFVQDIACVLDAEDWDACGTAHPQGQGNAFCVGVRFDTDGETIAYAVARKFRRGDGVRCIHTELVSVLENTTDTTPIQNFIFNNKDKIALVLIDGKNGADALETELINNGMSKRAVKVATTGQVVEAATTYRNMCGKHTLTHFRQPALTESAISSIPRPIGRFGAWTFGDGAYKATPVAASALAVLAANTTKRDPTRKAKAHIL